MKRDDDFNLAKYTFRVSTNFTSLLLEVRTSTASKKVTMIISTKSHNGTIMALMLPPMWYYLL